MLSRLLGQKIHQEESTVVLVAPVLQHRSINTIRSAVSMTHRHITEGVPIGQHPLVTQLLKVVYNTRPPKPCYTETWNVDRVLDHLASLGATFF